MFCPEKHPYFEKFVDPKTGVVSYILKEKISEEKKDRKAEYQK